MSTKPLFKSPFILSMGPQRAGTSWLDRYLRSRGDLCLPTDVKEIFFFDRFYARGADFYQAHFKTHPDQQVRATMEISTTAFDHPHAPQRVFATFGHQIKLLCPLRDPVARSYSLYLHYKRYGIVDGSLQQACQMMPQIITSSFYAHHLENWLKYFSREHITFAFQENLEHAPSLYIAQICRDLGLPFMAVPHTLMPHYNRSVQPPFPLVAKWGQKGADWLRRHRLYPIINFAKNCGLKPLIFGTSATGTWQPAFAENTTNPQALEDQHWLREQLKGECAKLEALLGHSIEAWHDQTRDRDKANMNTAPIVPVSAYPSLRKAA